jgi:hypothetical protein
LESRLPLFLLALVVNLQHRFRHGRQPSQQLSQEAAEQVASRLFGSPPEVAVKKCDPDPIILAKPTLEVVDDYRSDNRFPSAGYSRAEQGGLLGRLPFLKLVHVQQPLSGTFFPTTQEVQLL